MPAKRKGKRLNPQRKPAKPFTNRDRKPPLFDTALSLATRGCWVRVPAVLVRLCKSEIECLANRARDAGVDLVANDDGSYILQGNVPNPSYPDGLFEIEDFDDEIKELDGPATNGDV